MPADARHFSPPVSYLKLGHRLVASFFSGSQCVGSHGLWAHSIYVELGTMQQKTIIKHTEHHASDKAENEMSVAMWIRITRWFI
jgi:hypothetical protein